MQRELEESGWFDDRKNLFAIFFFLLPDCQHLHVRIIWITPLQQVPCYETLFTQVPTTRPFWPKNKSLPLKHLPLFSVLSQVSSWWFFSEKIYWAKDIVFLFSEHGVFGARAWLNSYHGVSSPWVFAGQLPARAGSIQSAFSLEMEVQRFLPFGFPFTWYTSKILPLKKVCVSLLPLTRCRFDAIFYCSVLSL